jgi:hypothetical protein
VDAARVQALGDEVFERYRAGDLSGVRAAAEAYRSELGGAEPDELALLTADVEGLDLEVAGTLADSDSSKRQAVLDQADAVFERYALRPELALPATAAFALFIKTALLANAREWDGVTEVAERLAQFFAARADAGRQEVMAEHVLEVAYMVMGSRAFDQVIELAWLVEARMRDADSDAARALWARAQVLHVIAILYTGDTSGLPPVLRELHAGGADSVAAIDTLLSRWAGKPFWDGARVSALGNKIVLLDSLGQAADSADARAALTAELEQTSLEADADLITDEIRDALLM